MKITNENTLGGEEKSNQQRPTQAMKKHDR